MVRLFGFKHDRKLALHALAVAAEKKDVHSVFAGYIHHYYILFLLLIVLCHRHKLPPPIIAFDKVAFSYSGKKEDYLYKNLSFGIEYVLSFFPL